jgi:hypothetical protein
MRSWSSSRRWSIGYFNSFALDISLKIEYNENEFLVRFRVYDAGRLSGRPCYL